MAQTTSTSSYSFFENSPIYSTSVKESVMSGSSEPRDMTQMSPTSSNESSATNPDQRSVREDSMPNSIKKWEDMENDSHIDHDLQDHEGELDHKYYNEEASKAATRNSMDASLGSLSPPPSAWKEDHDEGDMSTPKNVSKPQRQQTPDHPTYLEFVEPKLISIPSPMVQQQAVQLQQRREKVESLMNEDEAQASSQRQFNQDTSPKSETSHGISRQQREGTSSPAISVSSLMQSSSPEVSMHSRNARSSFSMLQQQQQPQPIQREHPKEQGFQPSSVGSSFSTGNLPNLDMKTTLPKGNNQVSGGVSLGQNRDESYVSGPWGSSQIQGSVGLRQGSFGSGASPLSARGDSFPSSQSERKESASAGVIARPTPPSGAGNTSKDNPAVYASNDGHSADDYNKPYVQNHQSQLNQGLYDQYAQQKSAQQYQQSQKSYQDLQQPSTLRIQENLDHGSQQQSLQSQQNEGFPPSQVFQSNRNSQQYPSITQSQFQSQEQRQPPRHHQNSKLDFGQDVLSSESTIISPTLSNTLSPTKSQSSQSSYPYSQYSHNQHATSSSMTIIPPPQKMVLKNPHLDLASPVSVASFASPPPLLHGVPPPAPSAPPPAERYAMPPGVAQAFNANREASNYSSGDRGNDMTDATVSLSSSNKSGNTMTAGSSSLNPNRLSGGYTKAQVTQAMNNLQNGSPSIGSTMGGFGTSSHSQSMNQKSSGSIGIGGQLGSSVLVGGVKIPSSSLEMPRPPSIFEEDPIPAEYRPGKRIQSADGSEGPDRMAGIPEKTGSSASNYSTGNPGLHSMDGGVYGSGKARQGLVLGSSVGSNTSYMSGPMPSLGITTESVLRGQWDSTTATSIPAVRQRETSGDSSYLRSIGVGGKGQEDDKNWQRHDSLEDGTRQRHPSMNSQHREPSRSRDPPSNSMPTSGGQLPDARGGYVEKYHNHDGTRGTNTSDFSNSQYQTQQSRDRHQPPQPQRYTEGDHNPMPRSGQTLQHLHSQVQAATERAQHPQGTSQNNLPQWSAGNGISSTTIGSSSSSYKGIIGNQQHHQQQQHQHSSQQPSQFPRAVLTPPAMHAMSPEIYQHTNPSVGPTPDLPILSHPSLRRTKSMEQKESEDDYYDSLSQVYPTLPTDHLRSLHKFALFLFEDAMAADRVDKLKSQVPSLNNNHRAQSLMIDDEDDFGELTDRLQQLGEERMKKWNDWVDQEDAERRRLTGVMSPTMRSIMSESGRKNRENSGGPFESDRDNLTPTDDDNTFAVINKDSMHPLPAPRRAMSPPKQYLDHYSQGKEHESPVKSRKSDPSKSLLDLSESDEEQEERREPSPPENIMSPSPTPTYIQVAKAPKVDLELQMPRPMITVATTRIDPSANRRHDDEASNAPASDNGDANDVATFRKYQSMENRNVDTKSLNNLLASFNRGNTGRDESLSSGQSSSHDIPQLLRQASTALETATNNPSLETYLTDARRQLEAKTLRLLRDSEIESISRRQMHQNQSSTYYSSRRYSMDDLERMNMDFEKQEARFKLEVEQKIYEMFENEYVTVAYKDVKRQLEILGGKWYDEVRMWLMSAASSSKTISALDYHLILECIDLLNKFYMTMEQHEHVLQNLVSERNGRYLQISIAPLMAFGDNGRAAEAERRFWVDEQEQQLLAKKEAMKRAREHASGVELVVLEVIKSLKRKFEEVVDGVNGVIFQFHPSALPDLFRRFFDADKGRNMPLSAHSDADYIVPKAVVDVLRECIHNLSDLLGLIKLALDFQNEPQIKMTEAKCSLQVAEDHARSAGVTSPAVTSAACSAGLTKVLPSELKRLREDQIERLRLTQEDLIDVLRRLNNMVIAFETEPRLPTVPVRNSESQAQSSQSWSGHPDNEMLSNHASSSLHNSYDAGRWTSQMPAHQNLGSLGGVSSSQQPQMQQHSPSHPHQHGQHLLHGQHAQMPHHNQLPPVGSLHHGSQQSGQAGQNSYMLQQQIQQQQQQQQQQRLGGMPQQQQGIPALRTMLGNLRAGHNFGMPPQGSISNSYGGGFTSGNAGNWNGMSSGSGNPY